MRVKNSCRISPILLAPISINSTVFRCIIRAREEARLSNYLIIHLVFINHA